jgi:hypothetical protein
MGTARSWQRHAEAGGANMEPKGLDPDRLALEDTLDADHKPIPHAVAEADPRLPDAMRARFAIWADCVAHPSSRHLDLLPLNSLTPR